LVQESGEHCPFEPLSDQARHDLLEEGERLVRFVADEAETFEIRFSANE
jgi:hypothetical protein